jgi:hypothetical protein
MPSYVPLVALLAALQQDVPIATLREEMRIVSSDASLGTSLTAVSEGSTVLPDGRILLVHQREGVIRIFDPSGRFLTMLGRLGDGPGEFRSPVAAGTVGDTIWIRDNLSNTYTLFAPELSYLRVLTTPRSGQLLGLASSVSSVHRTGTDTTFTVATYGANGDVVRTLPVNIRRAAHRFDVRDPGTNADAGMRGAGAGTVRGAGGAVVMSSTPQIRTIQSPFAASTSLGRARNGGDLVILESAEIWGGRPGQFTIRRMNVVTGSLSAPVTVTRPPRRITAAGADSAINSALRIRPQIAAEYRSKVRVPEYYPAFVMFEVDHDGLIWVREYGEAGSAVVYDAAGRPLMRVQFPEGLSVFARNRTHVWGVLRDANDLPIVVRYRVVTRMAPHSVAG